MDSSRLCCVMNSVLNLDMGRVCRMGMTVGTAVGIVDAATILHSDRAKTTLPLRAELLLVMSTSRLMSANSRPSMVWESIYAFISKPESTPYFAKVCLRRLRAQWFFMT